jgi:hypothetical protein
MSARRVVGQCYWHCVTLRLPDRESSIRRSGLSPISAQPLAIVRAPNFFGLAAK